MSGQEYFFLDAAGGKRDRELWDADLGDDRAGTWDLATDPPPRPARPLAKLHALFLAKGWQAQPRVPAGSPAGGEWTEGGGGPAAPAKPRARMLEVPDAKTVDAFRDWEEGQKEAAGHGPYDIIHSATHRHYFGTQNYRRINAGLRDPAHARPEDRAVVEQIDHEFRTSPFALPAGATVLRGVAPDFAALLIPGGEFTDKAFVSTTVVKTQATRARGAGAQTSVLTRITLATPTKTLINGSEGEFLLPRGTRFRVVKKTKGAIHLEAIVPEEYRP